MEEGALPTIPPLQFGAPGGTVVQEDAQGGLLKEGHPMLPGGQMSAEYTEQQKFAKLVSHVAGFHLTRRQMLRATPAHRVLHGFGWPLRGGAYSDKWLQHSQVTSEIAEFWSHSWHGPVWMKIALLMVVCNGRAALAVGTCAVAVVTPLLVVYDASSQWCLLVGLLTSALTLCFWRPATRVFFDKICIPQDDPELRVEGVVNVGAYVKYSKAMLACWDRTYMSRLWCVLEMAAFLKTHEDARSLTIRPTSWGPTTMLLFVSYWAYTAAIQVIVHLVDMEAYSAEGRWISLALVFSAANAVPQMLFMPFVAHSWRTQIRNLETGQAQLSTFSFDRDVQCHCCTVQHVHPVTGRKMLCDREIITECLQIWFGSVTDFEVTVQEKVAPIFKERFRRQPLPYLWVVGATIPTFWQSIYNIAQSLHYGAGDVGLQLFSNLSFWLAAFPVLLYMELNLAYFLRKRSARVWQEVLLNLALAFIGSLLFTLWLLIEAVCISILRDVWHGSAVSSSMWILLAIVVWCR